MAEDDPNLIWEKHSAVDLDDETLFACYKLVRGLRQLYLAAGEGWKKSDKIAEMRSTPQLQYLIVREAKTKTVAGFISYVLHDEDDHGEPTTFIYEIHVAFAHRGRKIGTKLLKTVESEAPGTLTLRVFPTNKRAVKFYKAHDFVIDSELCTDSVYYMYHE